MISDMIKKEKSNSKTNKAREVLMIEPEIQLTRETINNANNDLERLKKEMEPALKSIENIHKEMESVEIDNRFTLKDYRSTDSLILDELRELNKNKKKTEKEKNAQIVLSYNTEDNTLKRTIDGKSFSYDLSEEGKRKKLLDILRQNNGRYVKTEYLCDDLDSPSNKSISRLAQVFNEISSAKLHLNKFKIIQGKKDSGYRINPEVIINNQ